MSGIYLLRLPWPDRRLSQNARVHWKQRSEATAAALSAAYYETLHKRIPPMENVRLVFSFFPPDRRRRDVQNMPAMMKPTIDGIAKALRQDDNGFQCEFPSRFEAVVTGGCVMVEISDGTSPQTVVSKSQKIRDEFVFRRTPASASRGFE